MLDRIRAFLGALWVAITGLSLAQINVFLGTVSLVVGISYQLWKWNRERKQAK